MKTVAALTGFLLLIAIIVYLAANRWNVDPRPVVAGSSVGLKTESEFRNKVAELKRDREKLLNGIQRLELQKEKTLDYLREKGVTSSAEISGDKDVLYALNNLKGWKTEIANLQSQVANYDEAINSIVIMLDKLERERINRDVGLSDEQLSELRQIVVDLDERLGVRGSDILADEELGRILDEEMKAAQSDPSDQDPDGKSDQ